MRENDYVILGEVGRELVEVKDIEKINELINLIKVVVMKGNV